jgi:large subunit ribosomal protein L16
MLIPKKVKYRRQHRGRMKGKAQAGNSIAFGEFALQALEPAWVTSQQIEAARVAMTRFIKPVTAKPAETRMGSGKGAPEFWVAVVKPERVLFEIAGVPEDVAKEAMRLASHKLPIRTKFITKAEVGGDVGEGQGTERLY